MHGTDRTRPVRRRVGPALSALVLWGTAALLSAAAPRLEIPNMTVDVGVVHRGQVVEGRYVLRNRGDELLRILRAEPG